VNSEITRFEEYKDLPEQVRTYVRDAVSENTRRAYVADLNHFTEWGGRIPCEPETVAAYLVEHADTLAVATLKRRIAAISVAHEARGYPSPTSAKIVKVALRGIQRTHGSAQRQAKPLLVEDLMRIMAMLDDSAKDTRDKALLLIGFAGGFRRSELVAINCNDIELVRQGMTLNIGRSKTDQTGEGRTIGIPFARGRYCPVRTFETWRELVEVSDGPLFRPITRHGHIRNTRLSGEAVSIVVKERIAAIGHDPASYSGHSLRAGLATSAAMAGLSSLAIRQQTGHRTDATLARYIRSGELFTNNVAGALL